MSAAGPRRWSRCRFDDARSAKSSTSTLDDREIADDMRVLMPGLNRLDPLATFLR
jgi:hypothetical protein